MRCFPESFVQLIQPILLAVEGSAQSRQPEQGLIIARLLRYSTQVWCLCPLVSDPSLRDFHAKCVIAARCSRLSRNEHLNEEAPTQSVDNDPRLTLMPSDGVTRTEYRKENRNLGAP